MKLLMLLLALVCLAFVGCQRNVEEDAFVAPSMATACKDPEVICKAEDMFEGNQLDEADRLLEEASKTVPGHPRIAYLKEQVSIRRAQWAQEAAQLSDASAPEPPEAHLEKITALAKSEDWQAAHEACLIAKNNPHDYKAVSELCDRVTRSKNTANEPMWIQQAEIVASSKSKCDSPSELQSAWQGLKNISRGSKKNYRKAKRLAKRLNKCRLKIKKTADDGMLKIMVAQRESMLSKMQATMDSIGYGIKMSLSGRRSTHLKMKWVLMNLERTRELVAPQLMIALEEIGFESITLTDGYDFKWKVDLSPQDETNGGQKLLESFGLGQPLRL